MQIQAVAREGFRAVGIRVTDQMENLGQRLPEAWQELQRRMGEIRGVTNPAVTYGISPPNYKGNPGPVDFYVCVEVSPLENLPHGMVHLTVERQTYAYCDYRGPMGRSFEAYDATYAWMKQNGHAYFDAAYYLEVYDQQTNLLDHGNPDSRAGIYSPIRLRDQATTALIERVDSLFLTVRDLGRAVDFYTGVLGMKLLNRWSGGADLEVNGGATLLTLMQTEAHQPAGILNGLTETPRFNLKTRDAAAAHTTLKVVGVQVSALQDDGIVRYFRFNDPDGNLVGICQELAGSPLYHRT